MKITHPEDGNATPEVKRFVRYGASPRAAQAILASSRAKALLEGRFHVSRDDVNIMVTAALRHRMILSFEGEAEGITTDEVIQDIIRKLN